MNKKIIPLLLSGVIFWACSSGTQSSSQEKTANHQEQKDDDKKTDKEKKKLLKKATKGMKQTDSGLYYKIIEKGDGPQPQKGDIVKVHYTGTLLDGTKFDSSVDRGEPLPLKLGVGMVIKGWDEGIALLHVGDSARLVIPANLAYGERGAGKLIGPNETLVFDVKLVEIVDAGPFNTEGKEEKSTPSGLKYYIIEEHPDAPTPQKGQKVVVHYTGYLQDGTKFDSSWDRMQPFVFPLGQGRVIKGWDEGIALLHKGEKARLIIPPHLGYGKQGAGGVIPPDATLIFDVELVDIK